MATTDELQACIESIDMLAIDLKQAREKVQGMLIDREFEEAKPPEPEYRHGDPVYSEGTYGIYIKKHREYNGYHWVSINGVMVNQKIKEIRPAPYRIRLRPDDNVSEYGIVTFKTDSIDADSKEWTVEHQGKSAQVEIIE